MLYFVIIFNDAVLCAPRQSRPDYEAMPDEWLHTFWTNAQNGPVTEQQQYPIPVTRKLALKALADARKQWPGVSYMIVRADLNPFNVYRIMR